MSDRHRALVSIDPLEARVAALEAIVSRLVGRGARDAEDLRLVSAIYEYAASVAQNFTASQVMTWPRPELVAALRAADIDDAKQLGELLHRLRARDLDGLVVERLRRKKAGAHWRVCDRRQVVSPRGPGAR